jgi:DNA modification methylase
MTHQLHHGDCLEVLRSMPDCSVDSIVTDPPYGLSFMGKKWDYDVPSVDVWVECLRVLKPGGHLLAFAGTRTQHRMAVRIEDAGFEIRDMIAWVYGSGFPKSLDVSKAIDKNNGEVGRLHKFTEWMRTTGLSAKQINDATGTFMGSHYLTDKSQPAIPTRALWGKLRPLCGLIPAWVDELVDRIEAEREVVGKRVGVDTTKQSIACAVSAQGLEQSTKHEFNITAPSTDAAKQWQGWGTALKPALEPITVARKPLVGTVAENVLQHGTGALNIDGCRVRDGSETGGEKPVYAANHGNAVYGAGMGGGAWANTDGRWPANFIHDGSEEATDLLKDSARFFYCAKASKADRGENHHPTVKPTDLMRYLCRLVTPPNGIVLDPFNGSGSTGCAAVLEGFQYIGIEREAEYIAISEKRIEARSKQVQEQPKQLTLL